MKMYRFVHRDRGLGSKYEYSCTPYTRVLAYSFMDCGEIVVLTKSSHTMLVPVHLTLSPNFESECDLRWFLHRREMALLDQARKENWARVCVLATMNTHYTDPNLCMCLSAWRTDMPMWANVGREVVEFPWQKALRENSVTRLQLLMET